VKVQLILAVVATIAVAPSACNVSAPVNNAANPNTDRPAVKTWPPQSVAASELGANGIPLTINLRTEWAAGELRYSAVLDSLATPGQQRAFLGRCTLNAEISDSNMFAVATIPLKWTAVVDGKGAPTGYNADGSIKMDKAEYDSLGASPTWATTWSCR
jgi:hypothetical protein